MRIFAFQGHRYRAPSPGDLAAPPYDQIDVETRDRLHREPLHFAHLTRPVPSGELDAHRNAARLHGAWIEQRHVAVDDPPRLYAVSIDLADGERRLGLAALVGLENAGNGVIRPHEKTVDKTVAERLDLLRTLPVDLEPILLLADDDGVLDRMLAEDLATGDVVATHRDDLGNEHHLVPLPPSRTPEYRRALADAPGLIADGHHRYRTAALYAVETEAPEGSAAACKLSVITSLQSPALTIDPIHRALPRPLVPAVPARGVLERRPLAAASGAEIVAAVAAAGPTALGVTSAKGTEIWTLDPAAGPSHLPAAASQLAVVLLHETLLPQWGYTEANAVDGTILYRSKPEVLYRAVTAGELPVGLWLPPMSPEGSTAPSPRATSSPEVDPLPAQGGLGPGLGGARQHPRLSRLRCPSTSVPTASPSSLSSPTPRSPPSPCSSASTGARRSSWSMSEDSRRPHPPRCPPWPGEQWEPPTDRDVVLFDAEGDAAVEIARRYQQRGHPRVKALFGGLDLWTFALDPEVVGEETYLESLDGATDDSQRPSGT
ncbi:MAG: DUF1015 family protein [Thermoanaerobaculia bacterium]